MKKTVSTLCLLLALLAACSTPATEAPISTDAPTLPPASQVDQHADDLAVASQMSGFLSDEQAVEKYYRDGTTALAQVTLDVSTVSWWSTGSARQAVPPAMPRWTIEDVPPEFLTPLPEDGVIAAPAGACPAAAQPSVQFQTGGGNTVTPALISQLGLTTLPTSLVTMAQNQSGSLTALINSLVQMGDQRLATADGWNQLLWDKLKEMQVPVESLMDYQLWNASSGIEQIITSLYLQKLQTAGAPPIVINAFNASATTGWYANLLPTPEDALAQMDIQAVMTGSVQGTVHEQRAFTIPGVGQTPVYGQQTGAGTVTWDHPSLGPLTFEVEILLDQFDAQGRAIGGTVYAVSPDSGYEVRFTFLPDGTKQGELLRDGQVVGLMSMTTNAEEFENYVDLQTDQTEPLP